MNQDQIAGKFEQLKGQIKQTWSKLSDDDILLYNGKQDEFFGKLQEKYGLAREAAEKSMKSMQDACVAVSDASKPSKVA